MTIPSEPIDNYVKGSESVSRPSQRIQQEILRRMPLTHYVALAPGLMGLKKAMFN